MMIRLVIGLIIAIVSFSYLFGVAIPHVQQAQEKVRIAQIEYDEAHAELDQSMADLNTSVDEILNEESIN
jgi:uncharacterized membrane-anchored protein YhcB (DUF1043 family)